MLRNLGVFVAAVAAFSLSAMPLAAGPLEKEVVAAGAQWVIHADIEAFMASKVGVFVDQQTKQGQVAAGLEVLRNMSGIDLTKDIQGVTLYGTEFSPDAGVIVVRGKLDQPKLLALIKANETYKELKYGEHVVHQWIDKPKGEAAEQGKPGVTKYGAFYKDTTAVMAQDFEKLKLALDVLDKKSDNLAKPGAVSPVAPAAKGAYLAAGAVGLAKAGAVGPAGNLFMGRLSSATMEMGEDGEKLFLRLAVTTRSARMATDLRKIVDGLLGAVDLLQDREPGEAPIIPIPLEIPAEVSAILKDISASSQGDTVKVELNTPVANVISLIQFAMAKKQGAPAEAPPAPAAK